MPVVGWTQDNSGNYQKMPMDFFPPETQSSGVGIDPEDALQGLIRSKLPSPSRDICCWS